MRRRLEIARNAAPDLVFKAILETGALSDTNLIRAASHEALLGGAHFIKTSTGKGHEGATLDAAEIMIDEIIATGGAAGLKPSGGISTPAFAQAFLDIFETRLGKADPTRFRIGASSLLSHLLANPGCETSSSEDATAY